MNWRKNFNRAEKAFLCLSVLVAPAFFNSCAEQPMRQAPSKQELEAAERKRLYRRYQSQYEWAVQHFEAGQYDKALISFQELSKDGAVVGAFQNIPYYLGMCYFREDRLPEAESEFEFFLASHPEPLFTQDGGMHLLLIFEKEKAWDKLVALAAEFDKTNLYQNNHILLKLLWGNALLEQGELLGARQTLTDALSLLNNQPSLEYEPEMSRENSNSDLWGRYYFTSLKAKLLGCERLSPKEIQTAKKKSEKLYGEWIEASTSCYQDTEKMLLENFLKSQSSWLASAFSVYSASLDIYGPKLAKMFFQDETHLQAQRDLTAKARQSFYELLHFTEEASKEYENQPLAMQHLNGLQKQFDRLIYSLALPSSNK